MSKTIREWLEELPEPYRSQALANRREHADIAKADTQSDAIAMAFDWNSSPEGAKHWSRLCGNISPEGAKHWSWLCGRLKAGESVDLPSLVRAYFTVKDEMREAIMGREDDTRRIGEDMDKAEKALREAVGL